MAGTDSTKHSDMHASSEHNLAIILVRPQLSENIGMCCRAMLNNGLTDLRLVLPRDGWPTQKGRASASGADIVVDNARVFETTEQAVADLNLVYATSARQRDSAQITHTPRQAALEMHQTHNDGLRAGVLFGPEAKGLNNDDLALSDAILAVPLNPAFKSLNLAQAVFCISYEWFQASLGDTEEMRKSILPTAQEERTRLASKADLIHMFEHLEKELDDCGFLRPPEKRPTMVRNIRTMFQRAQMTDQEVRTMRGMISGLVRKHLR